jgi:hypothetical protein
MIDRNEPLEHCLHIDRMRMGSSDAADEKSPENIDLKASASCAHARTHAHTHTRTHAQRDRQTQAGTEADVLESPFRKSRMPCRVNHCH